MSSTTHFRLIVGALFLIGISLFLYRWLALEYPVTPDAKTEIWRVEVQIDLENRKRQGLVTLQVPPTDENYRVISEEFVSNGLPIVIRKHLNGNREALWSAETEGIEATVFYRGVFQKRDSGVGRPLSSRPPRPSDSNEPLEDAREIVAQGLADQLRDSESSTEEKVLFLLQLLKEPGNASVRSFAGAPEDLGRRVRVAARVLELANIPARPVNGIELTETRSTVRPVPWLEVWTGKEWRSYDVEMLSSDGYDSRLLWWRGAQKLYDTTGLTRSGVRIAIAKQTVGSVATLKETRGGDGFFSAFSFSNLTVNSQLVFQLLVMIPVGIVVLVIARQMIGIRTLGTFMPVLIALVFLVSGPIYGIVFFTSLIAIGLLVRLYLAQLDLMLVPRLAAMLVIVIGLMAIFSFVADALTLGLGLSVSLFPVVIMTMTIERMSVTWEENGPQDALIEGVGSLVVAIAAYLAMQSEHLAHLLFVFPELMLVLLALLMLIGRYSGFRLTEFRRFRDFDREMMP